jgi:putative ABC transport system permease protein
VVFAKLVRADCRFAARAVDAMQLAMRAVDPLLPFAKARTLEDVRDEAVATPRAQATLVGVLAGLALLLTAIGLYGLVANAVAERTRELAIRMALGASRRQVIASAAMPGAAVSLAGVAAGLLIARFGAPVLRHLIWGVTISDPLSFAVAGATVLSVALLASLLAALRIAWMSPIRALRSS